MVNKENVVKILIFLLFLTTIIITEIFYRNKLFNKSLTAEKNSQNFFGKKFFKTYFSFFSLLGEKLIILPYIIFICTSPINYSLIQIFILDISIYFTTFFKSIYKNPRPFWINNDLLTECNGGYGNPSGHSITSTSVYLSMAYFLSNYKYFRKSRLNQIIIYVCFSFLIFNIIFSRLYLGVHSINQVIYGFLIGLCIFYFVFFIFQIQKKKPKEFLDFIDKNKIWIILGYLILFFIPFPLIFTKDKNKDKYINIINELCPKIKEYKILEKECLHQLLQFLSFVGIIFGMIYCIEYLKTINIEDKEKIFLNWCNNNKKYKFEYYQRIILFFSVAIISYIIFYLIFQLIGNSHLKIFGTLVFTGLLSYGIFLINKDIFIYIENNHNDDEEEKKTLLDNDDNLNNINNQNLNNEEKIDENIAIDI